MFIILQMAIAGVVGLIAVLDADNGYSALGIGFGIAWTIFLSGGTIACALACLARGRLAALSLGTLVAAGGRRPSRSGDLARHRGRDVRQARRDAFVGALFGLIVLGLTLACQPRDALARYLYRRGRCIASRRRAPRGPHPHDRWRRLQARGVRPARGLRFGNDLVRPLAAVLVVLAALWFAALATSRVERLAAD